MRASASGVREVAWLDCPGGGQVRVEGGIAYLGHMRAPHGTTLVDVRDPRRPRVLSQIAAQPGTHSHKVRVHDGLMLVNRERAGEPGAEFTPGLGIFDVCDPTRPRPVAHWPTVGKGVHRFDFDGRHAYLSSTLEGFVGNVVVILDLVDPTRPTPVGRWWIPGQWQAGGEEYPWGDGPEPRCHHPLRMGDRLYVSYWHHGCYILDISDLGAPKQISELFIGPAFPHPRHTALPIPFAVRGRRLMVVADEDVSKLRAHAPAFAWIVDVTDERHPVPVATWQVPGLDPDGAPQPPMTGCHQPSEVVTGTEIPFAWFAQGLRIVDIADPQRPVEAAHYLPEPVAGEARVRSNDVTLDDRGLVYLYDRVRGLHILERC
jgi:hypothetical protein